MDGFYGGGEKIGNGLKLGDMSDRSKLYPCLRAFNRGIVSIDYTVDFILTVSQNSKRFNWSNFSWGFCVGAFVALLIVNYLK
jgi:hypothetical protein